MFLYYIGSNIPQDHVISVPMSWFRSPFVVWETLMPSGSLESFTDDEPLWNDLAGGVSVAGRIPADAYYEMDDDDDDDTPLTDTLPNLDDFLVVSRRLADLIVAGEPHVERYPLAIWDRADREVSRDYVLLHPIDPVDCLDLDRCKPRRRKDGSISSIDKLVIDADRVPADRKLFRPQHFTDVVLVRRAFAEAITAADITNLRWCEPRDFTRR
jgi:hypothetical protein